MRNKNAKYRAGTAFLSAAMMITSGPMMTVTTLAQEQDAVPSAKSSTDQISTIPKTSYVSVYDGSERSADFDASWSFYLGEASGVEQSSYDDSAWETVNVPHDYSLIQDFDPNLEGESAYKPGGTGWYRKAFTLDESVKGKRVRIDFDGVYNNATIYINGHKLGSHPYGYTPFSYDLSDYLNYEGENLIAVKCEHQTPSSRWYSGSGIYRDVRLTITDDVHVDLFGTTIRSDKLEEQKDGDVDTSIETVIINDSDADKTVTVRQTLRPLGSDAIAATVTSEPQTLTAGSSTAISQSLKVNKPALWSTDSPNLYVMTTEILEDGNVIDTYDTQYGFRYFKFDANTGFSLNGVSMKLNGVCMHHDQGALGSAANQRAIERQIEILKEMGCNAIRTSHNPASQALLDMSARHGILLMEEFFDGWSTVKNGNTYDYSSHFNEAIAADNEILHKLDGEVWSQWDLQETIRRGRNNPAIIIWDIGNEVEHGNTTEFPTIADNLIKWIQEMDNRPFILGDNKTLPNGGNKTLTNDTTNSVIVREKIVNAGGLVGSNYGLASNLQVQYRNAHPDWKFLGTENVSAVNSRGIYDRTGSQTDKNGDRQLTSYDYSAVSWGHTASQAMLEFVQNDWFAGEFVWTGFDYLGEPTPWNGITPGPEGGWPAAKNSFFGIVDTAGFPKDTYYFYRSIWKQDDTTLHILPAWKSNVVCKDSSGKVPVVVYTNAHSVKLEFTPADGGAVQDLGTKTFTEKTTANGYKWRIYEGSDKENIEHRNLYLNWKVPYADGTLTATAYDASGAVISKTVGRNSVKTYGNAVKLSAVADRTEISADGKDLTYISVDVQDAEGNFVNDAANRVTFTVEGEGKLVGVDNGSSPDHQSYQDDNRQAFSGKVLAIVQSTTHSGPIKVTASADGLESSTVLINASGGEDTKEIESLTYVKSAYIKAGIQPELPAQAEVTWTDGSKEMADITWDAIDPDDLSHTGTVAVKGSAAGQITTFYINVIDTIGAIQNYSAAAATGTTPVLPDTRPVIMPDGEKIAAMFPVEWESLEGKDFTTPGIVTIHGTSDVMGTVYPVTATIRVKDPEETWGSNEVVLHGYSITQDIPENLQSDTLMAIKDGSSTLVTGGGTNQTAWSNYNSAKQGDHDSQITIKLDTAALIGKAVIYFGSDNWSMTYPKAGSTKFEISQTGNEWTEIEYTEEIGEETGEENAKVKAYTFNFDPVQATEVRVTLNDDTTATMEGGFPCTAITELELYPIIRSFAVGSSTDLEKLTINGRDEEIIAPDASVIKSAAWLANTFEAVAKDNASVTVLPQSEKLIRLLIESEDHESSRLADISLQNPKVRDPESADFDYPTSGMSAAATSVYPGTGVEGPVSHVLDGNAGTYFHTDYNTDEGAQLTNRHVDLIFDEPKEIGGLRYLPRATSGSGGQNGQVVTYKIQYQAEEGGDWNDLTEGSWPFTTGWKKAEFTPVTAKAVRLIGVETMTDGSKSNTDMSVAELRVMKPNTVQDIAALENLDVTVPSHVTAAGNDLDLSDQITVKAGEDPLVYGSDYYLSYELLPQTNQVKVIVHGAGDYSGQREYLIAATITELDTYLLERTIAAGEAIVTDTDSWQKSGMTTLSEKLEAGRTALKDLKSQKAVDDAASALSQALLNVRLKPSNEKLETLK